MLNIQLIYQLMEKTFLPKNGDDACCTYAHNVQGNDAPMHLQLQLSFVKYNWEQVVEVNIAAIVWTSCSNVKVLEHTLNIGAALGLQTRICRTWIRNFCQVFRIQGVPFLLCLLCKT